MKEANGKIYQNASSQEFKFSESEQFLVNMFESSYKDLDAVFSPLLHPVGSQKYMEQLMFRNVLGSLKKSLHTGKIAPSDALTNIHTFKDKPFEFVESTIAMPIMRSAFESSYKELSQIFSPSLYRAASREHIEQLLLSDVLGSLKKKVQSGGLTRTEALKNISMFQDNPRGFIELTLGKPFDEALYATKAWKNMAKAKK